MEEAERNTPTVGTIRRRSRYQFPYLEGYNGPPPPDLATILARQEEQERLVPPQSDSDAESTSSSLISLGDEDDTADKQPQVPDAVLTDAEISPRTRVTVVEQPPVTSTRQPLSSTMHTAVSASNSTLDIPDFILLPEDIQKGIEKGRENARRLRASYEEEKAANQTYSVATEAALAKEIQRVQELTRELEDLRKVHDIYKTEAKDAQALNRELTTLRKKLKMHEKEQEKLTATKIALAEEKQSNAKLQQEVETSRQDLKNLSEESTKKLVEQSQSDRLEIEALRSDRNHLAVTDAELASQRDQVKWLKEELRQAKDEASALKQERGNHEIEIESLEAAKAALEAGNTKLNQQLIKASSKHEELFNHRNEHRGEPSRQPVENGDDPAANSDKTRANSISAQTQGKPSPAPSRLTSTTPAPAPAPAPATTTLSSTTLLPLLHPLRQFIIRGAGRLRTTTDDQTKLYDIIVKFKKELEDENVAMRHVKDFVKELVEWSEKVGTGLKGARECSESVKGEFMRVLDEVERAG
ncbi:MAG: hypothetical protein Q9166_003703 [cf. Caloplaca sp. 2 TL-2023]